MKNKTKHVRHVMAAAIVCMLAELSYPACAYASDGEDYITISVDAVDDNANLKYALDSDDEAAFTSSNEFTVPAGTSHTIYVKDAAGNITSQKYDPPEETIPYDPDPSYEYDEEEQRINIDLELGRKEKEEEIYSPDEEGNPGTASVTNRTKTDGTVDAEKVFYTFTTKEGEELYLVVDQGRGTDNVYLLDTVSLGDLRVLADGQDPSSGAGDKEEDNLLSILSEESTGSEPEELQTKKSKSPFGNGLMIMLLFGIGGGIYYYLKIYRNKKDEAMDAMDAMAMDEFEPEEDEEEEVDFDYDDSEKERYLENLINEESEEETFFDQDPDEYAAPYNEEGEDPDSEDEDAFDDIEVDF